MYSQQNTKQRTASSQRAFDLNRDEIVFIVIAVNKKCSVNLSSKFSNSWCRHKAFFPLLKFFILIEIKGEKFVS